MDYSWIHVVFAMMTDMAFISLDARDAVDDACSVGQKVTVSNMLHL